METEPENVSKIGHRHCERERLRNYRRRQTLILHGLLESDDATHAKAILQREKKRARDRERFKLMRRICSSHALQKDSSPTTTSSSSSSSSSLSLSSSTDPDNAPLSPLTSLTLPEAPSDAPDDTLTDPDTAVALPPIKASPDFSCTVPLDPDRPIPDDIVNDLPPPETMHTSASASRQRPYGICEDLAAKIINSLTRFFEDAKEMKTLGDGKAVRLFPPLPLPSQFFQG